MNDLLKVTGIVIKAAPIGEYDKLVTILTTGEGKLRAFARGAKRINSPLNANTQPFCFGEFNIYQGKNSYSINEANIKNPFREIREDLNLSLYGMYFLELCDYFARDNNPEDDLLKLLYQSLRALLSDKFQNEFVKTVFELKAFMLSGEYPGIPKSVNDPGAVYAMEFIYATTPEKLYSFVLSDEAFVQIKRASDNFRKDFIDKKFNSLELLEQTVL